MFLVAGLGNPGEEYENSPHNLGFRVIDRLAEEHGIRVTRKDSRALVGMGEIAGQPVMLAKPQTFMNLSGTSVKPLMEKHSLSAADLILVYDELDLPWGEIRIKARGSSAGHNGVESVISSLGTKEFTRVRLGVKSRASRERWRGVCSGANPPLATEGIGPTGGPWGRSSRFHNCRRRRKVHGDL